MIRPTTRRLAAATATAMLAVGAVPVAAALPRTGAAHELVAAAGIVLVMLGAASVLLSRRLGARGARQ